MIVNISGKVVKYNGHIIFPRLGTVEDYLDQMGFIEAFIVSPYMVDQSINHGVTILVENESGIIEEYK